MPVKVIAYTRMANEQDDLNSEDLIAYTARVSNPSNQSNFQTSSKLLKYLVNNKHWSPFEMANVVMEIETTRDIARQILRHRSFSFQEFSQRYADPTKDLGFTTREARLQDSKNRQNSIEVKDDDLTFQWSGRQQYVIDSAKMVYDWAINNGIAKEQARSVLPEGLTVSRMYMNGSVRSWIHYCQIRCHISTQKEHREIALDCWYNLIKIYPSLKELDLINP